MNDNVALTSRRASIGDMLRRWSHTIGWIVAVLFSAGLLTFLGLRLYATYTTQHRVTRLEQRLDLLKIQFDVRDAEQTERLDEIERVLFGDVTEMLIDQQQKLQKQRVTSGSLQRLEQWQANRDQELRDRIRALEQWRYEMKKYDP